MTLYSYTGPVMKFDTCVARNWSAETVAVSPSKARSNLAYRFKKENGLLASAKIKLTGELKAVS